MNLSDHIDLDEDVLYNLVKAIDNPRPMQTIMTSIENGDIEKSKDIHRLQMLYHLLFSIPAVAKRDDELIYFSSGFKNQKGRLPNINDKIRVIKGNNYFSVVDNMIISEFGFEILNNKP